ncbi:MAG: hypothetical protein RL236_366 [Pseudomonadota bacterium]|jgi:hypothetical protein
MSLRYLAEHAGNAKLALELAQKEVKHLTYTHQTLFSQSIDLAWVESLAECEDLTEKIDAFVSRFSRLQDHIGEKLIPRFAALLGESPKSLLDVLNYAEKMGWITDTMSFVSARKLRNLLVHEYMTDAELFLQSLQTANNATIMLIIIVNKLEQYADLIGLISDTES